MLQRPVHHTDIRIRNQLAGQGFHVHPVYKDRSGVPTELEPYFEPWRFSLVVVSDGTNPFYRFENGEGWAVNYVRFSELPTDVEMVMSDAEEDPVHPGEKVQLNYLAPGTVLRSVVVTDRIREQPGVNAAFGFTKPDGEKLWSILSLFPIQVV